MCSVITFGFLVNHVLVKHIDRCLLQVGWLTASLPHCTQKVIAILGIENKVKTWLVRLSGRIFLLLAEFYSFPSSVGSIMEIIALPQSLK